MKIHDKRTPITIPFKDIPVGECFITLSDNNINMKLCLDGCAYFDTYNAVDLVTGSLFYLEYDQEVIAVTAEIITTD